MWLPQWLSYKESTCSAADVGLIPGSRRYPWGGYVNSLLFSCWETSWTEDPVGYGPCGGKELDMAEATEYAQYKIYMRYLLFKVLN